MEQKDYEQFNQFNMTGDLDITGSLKTSGIILGGTNINVSATQINRLAGINSNIQALTLLVIQV